MCQVTFVNKTNDTWYYSTSGFLSDYKFIVKDSLGRILPLTAYAHSQFPLGINKRAVGSFSHFMGGLAPGKSLAYQFPINRLYDLTKQGEYTISVSREVIKPDQFIPGKGVVIKDKPFTITSNSIQINRKINAINNVKTESDSSENVPSNQAVPPSNQWQIGDNWKINVDIFRSTSPLSIKESVEEFLQLGQTSSENSMHVLDSYGMTIRVADIQKVGSEEHIKLIFTPNENSPSYVKGRTLEVILDRATHRLLEEHVSDHPDQNYLKSLNDQQVLVFPINGYAIGFPVDIIPQIAPANTAQLSAKYSDMHLDVNSNTSNGKQKIQESLSVKGKNWFRVTQIWPAGSHWWSEYLKEDFDSQIGMRARLAGASQIKWGAVTNGLQLGISSDDTLTFGGDPVRVHVALRNTLDQAVPVPSLFLGQNLQVKFFRGTGKETPLTELGKTVQAASVSVLPSKMIPPHSVLSCDISLDKVYDLSRAGIYSISASAGNSLQKSGKLESPELMIQVKNNNVAELGEE